MKNIKVYNKKNELISDENHYENEFDFINHIVSTNYFGLPERWILQNSEPYEDSDVLETEERTFEYVDYELNDLGHTIEVKKQRKEKWVKLKADYTIEIIDLDNDYDYLLKECHTKRLQEYPSLSELADALYWKENKDNSKYKEYIKKCDEVKKKYPKPIKGEI